MPAFAQTPKTTDRWWRSRGDAAEWIGGMFG